jgi:hypothetical protein
VVDRKWQKNVEYLNDFGSVPTNDARCTRKIESRIVVAKAAFYKKTLFPSKSKLYLKKKLIKSYLWSIALNGAESFNTVHS